MSQTNAIVAVYESHASAEEAVRELEKGGIDMRTLSIVGKGTHTDEHVVGYYNNGDRMMYWGKVGAYWGGFWGLLFGSAAFVIPGFGPVLMAGPIVASVVAALEGAAVVGGLGAIGAGLIGLGVPEDSVIDYETAIKTDKYLLMVHGEPEEVERARGLLGSTRRVTMHLHTAEKDAVIER